MTGIIEEPLTNLAELINARAISPVEVAEAYLRQISAVNSTLNAIVTLAPDFLDRARAVETALMKGDKVGALCGVPVTIKDTIETAGLKSTSGSAVRATFVPARDAPAVSRLKQAGAIVLGKTNAAEMAMDYTADNPLFGRTNNPYDLARSPGGSSGGEAAAIAACLSPGGLGSDLAGSIRIPAHFCGVVGLRPTTGRVPPSGHFPPSIGPYSLGAVIGPIARCVADVRTILRALTGDESSTVSQVNLKGVRVSWYTDDGVAPICEDTAEAVVAAANALAQAGLLTENRRPPHVDRGHELWLKLFSRASVVQLRDIYQGRENEAGSFVSWRLATADTTPAPTLDQYIAGWMERDRLREQLLDWMDTTPLIVTPVGATPAYEHDTLRVTVAGDTMSTFRAFSYAQTFNVFDLPAVTVPAGHSREGMPIGVQIAGRPFAEETVLAAAAIVEESLGGWRRPRQLLGVR